MAQRIRFVYAPKTVGFSWVRSLKPYFLVTKPATVFLLLFTGVVGFALASQGNFAFETFMVLLLALALGCAGANTLTCYVDRDIDAVMERTRNRPIPLAQIPPQKALIFGVVLVMVALGFSLYLNLLTFGIIVAGIVNNVVMYSIWTKRKTALNILVGSFAGGLPALAGYASYANAVDLRGLFLGGMVMLWIPVHVWSLALKHVKDYTIAGVPMLPVVIKKNKAARFIALMSGLLIVLSLTPAWLGLFGLFYLYCAAILGVLLFLLSLWLMFNPVETRAWVVFKVSSIYLSLLFLSVLVDSLFSI